MLDATASSPSISTSGSTTARFVSVGSRMIPDPLTMSGFGGVPDGEYDGGAKRAHLFLFDGKDQQARPLCLGFVGSGQDNKRFCLRPATIHDSSGRRFCGVQRHLTPFEPSDGTFYPRANEIIAFCSPCFPLAVVPLGDLEFAKQSKRSIQEWATMFKGGSRR